MKRQPRSATTLKKWRGEESPSVLRRRGCQAHRLLKNCKANCPKRRATLAGQRPTNCPHNRDLDRE
ncbi:MAG: hypothetical protein EWV84_16360 [Microcystis sp. M_QC_C_20170808_M3Col]|nr:MAG: hypothetical protein EWV84_16360 [Microcystis sp. M_QC_C_20170808_M3Col]